MGIEQIWEGFPGEAKPELATVGRKDIKWLKMGVGSRWLYQLKEQHVQMPCGT